MRYIFVLNGRRDKASILSTVNAAIAGLDFSIDFEIYSTEGAGDATRYVNLYCDLNPDEQTCFVACGGSGISNEVASALVGKHDKTFAIFHCDGTNDFVKSFPGRDFTDLRSVLSGTPSKIDVIRLNDNYSINMVNVGLDAYAAQQANENILEGRSNPYVRAVTGALFLHRINRIGISIDGEVVNRRYIQQMIVANGRYYGGNYNPTPEARVDDGLIDVMIIKPMFLLPLLYFLKKFEKGTHITDKFCMSKLIFRRCRHLELWADNLIYLCFDGEIIASNRFDIDILEKAITILIPQGT